MRRYFPFTLAGVLLLGGCGGGSEQPGPTGQSTADPAPVAETPNVVDQTERASGSPGAVDDAVAIIDKAIQAQGGEAMVAKLRAMRIKVKGKGAMIPGQADIPFTLEDTWQMPDKYKTVIGCELNGMKIAQTMVINGGRGWISVNSQTQSMPEAALAEMREQKYAEDLDRLLVLKQGRYQLSMLPTVDIDGRPAVGVKVTAEGHRDVQLYFDKSSGLLVKREQTILDETRKLVSQEVFFTDYQDRGGVKYPMKIAALRDGKRSLEADVIEVEFLEQVDDKVFAKP